MLETLDLGKKVSKAEYTERMPALQLRLLQLQRASWAARIPSIIVFAGWDAAGKGSTIGKLTQRLEPRGFSLHAIHEPRTYEKHFPWMRRFWTRLPNYGEMAIFDRSWFARVHVERVEQVVNEREWRQAYEDIVNFERALADDNHIIVKFYLHITKKEQARRFKKMEADPHSAWQVTDQDWKHHKQYDEYMVAVEEMLARTDSEWAPWTLVESTDKRWTRIKVFETLIVRLESGLKTRGVELPAHRPVSERYQRQDED